MEAIHIIYFEALIIIALFCALILLNQNKDNQCSYKLNNDAQAYMEIVSNAKKETAIYSYELNNCTSTFADMVLRCEKWKD